MWILGLKGLTHSPLEILPKKRVLKKVKFPFLSSPFFGFSCLRFLGRILELDERKGSLVVEQNFHGNFQVNVTWFFVLFSAVLD